MSITHQGAVFLGVVVNPKTKQPVFVERADYRTVEILSRGRYHNYVDIGSGYLDGGDMGDEYLVPVNITGFPRSHTPDGVRMTGGGYGTCLYTGLVLLASAFQDRDIIVPGTPGRGYGICSATGSRSRSADEWWQAAVDRGLADETEGEGGEETETEHNEDLTDYMSSRSAHNIFESIKDAVSGNSEWWPTSIEIRGDIERTVSSDSVTANYYTLKSALKHRLVAVRETYDGDMGAWVRSKGFDGQFFAEVILALNVSQENLDVVGRLAACAREAGATEAEVNGLVLRNRFGLDKLERSLGSRGAGDIKFGSPPQSDMGVLVDDPRLRPTPNPRRRRQPPARELPMIRNPDLPTPSRSETLQLERELDKLQQRRSVLGWNTLEDLP